MKHLLITLGLAARLPGRTVAQSADGRIASPGPNPQVRSRLADRTLGGNATRYRDDATQERDFDAVEAIRRWETGSRVVNTNDFERRWVGKTR